MTSETHPDGRLFDLYREYIGEPEETRDVYVGFGLFLVGIGLAIVALLLFVWSSTLEPRSSTYFAWVQPAYALGMLSLPTTMLGIVVLLPAERRVLYASIAGASITALAVVGFVWLYPSNWNFYESGDTAISTVHVVALYAIGLAGITASTGAALIAHYLDLAREIDSLDAGDDEEEAGERYSDEEIQEDIDAAMEDVELSWGGVEKTENTRLSFDDHEFEGANLNLGAKTKRSSGVDAQVAGLKGLKGGETKKTTSKSTVDDQTQKLKELREQQRKEQAEAAAEKTSASPIERFIERVRALF